MIRLVGSGVKYKVFALSNVYTPTNTGADQRTLTHNLNTFHIQPRLSYHDPATTSSLSRRMDFFVEVAQTAFRGFQHSFPSKDQITVQIYHDGNGGYYNMWLELWAYSGVEEVA